jgi:VanZ family protein
MPYRKYAAATVVLAAGYWAAIFLATHLPIKVDAEATGADKIAHFVMYATLAALVLSAVAAFRPVGARATAGVVLAAAAYGALDEWTQGFVGRTSDFWDWMADTAGAICGAGFYLAARRYFMRRQSGGR